MTRPRHGLDPEALGRLEARVRVLGDDLAEDTRINRVTADDLAALEATVGAFAARALERHRAGRPDRAAEEGN